MNYISTRTKNSEKQKSAYVIKRGLAPDGGLYMPESIPALTEETRRDYVKQAKAIAEEAKIALRNIRQDANKALENLELPEDEEKRGNERVQDLINEYNKVVDEKLKDKEKDKKR